MAEPLKNHFGPDIPGRLAGMVGAVHTAFDQDAFLALALDGFDGLELTERAKQIAGALASTLPEDRDRAIRILVSAVEAGIGEDRLAGMASFLYLPLIYFVADQGLGCFETSMWAQYQLTKRFTAEFSIRAFLDHFPTETLERLRVWAEDPDPRVRRLVSEGTRPRLPWAPRLQAFLEDPGPVLALLEILKDDPEEFVRRSVANNLNDISKDHPELAVEVARRWWATGGEERRRLVSHGLRTLVKRGHPGALEVLGFSAASPATVTGVRCDPDRVDIGGTVRISVDVLNPSDREAEALVDLVVHFVKASGATAPKTFKGTVLSLGPGETRTVNKTISVAQQSTRTHYAGRHRVEVLLNGTTFQGAEFDLV